MTSRHSQGSQSEENIGSRCLLATRALAVSAMSATIVACALHTSGELLRCPGKGQNVHDLRMVVTLEFHIRWKDLSRGWWWGGGRDSEENGIAQEPPSRSFPRPAMLCKLVISRDECPSKPRHERGTIQNIHGFQINVFPPSPPQKKHANAKPTVTPPETDIFSRYLSKAILMLQESSLSLGFVLSAPQQMQVFQVYSFISQWRSTFQNYSSIRPEIAF